MSVGANNLKVSKGEEMSEWAVRVWVWEKGKGSIIKKFVNFDFALEFIYEFNAAHDPSEAYASIEAE
jgi:hypothetical protein